MESLDEVRRRYAQELARTIGLAPEGALVDAFATVPRERFLGPGPWSILGRGGYQATPDADPRHVYQDVLVGLVTERRLNNGQPSFLASLMRAGAIAAGEHVVHLGCGTGYYSAVIAELVGPSGRVTAIEADPALAARAIDALADRPNVNASHGDAASVDFDAADLVLVNFGVTHPLLRWIDRLKSGARLLVPITAANGIGTVIGFQLRDDGVAARPVGPTQIFSSVSTRDPAREATLQERFADGPTAGFGVASLRRDEHAEDETCWLHGEDVCLSTRALDPRAPLEDYAGTFATESGEVVFSVRRGALHAASAAGSTCLLASSVDGFRAPGVASMRFERDADGRVCTVEITFGAQQVRARRIA